MKKALVLLFLVILLTINSITYATDYYISSSGNDLTNSGTSSATPWKTISKVNSAFSTLKAGDRILFNRGDTFYGTLNITKSGSAGNPITIGAFGTGSNPIITGFTIVTGWTSKSSGIFSKVVTCESAPNLATVDAVNTPIGRWPATGWRYYESHSGNNSITDKELSGSPDWDGAELIISPNSWTIDRKSITDHTNNSITFSPSISTTIYDGYGYFIQNDLKCLGNKLGEWCYNSGTTTFYMYFNDNNPDNHLVKLVTLDKLVSISGYNYVTFDGLTFEGSNLYSFYLSNAGHIIVQNCKINFSGNYGLFGTGATQNLLIDNNEINQTNNNAIWLNGGCTYAVISNNIIQNTGIIPGLVKSAEQNCCGILYAGDNSKVIYNQIFNSGYAGIIGQANNTTVQYNFLNYFCLTKDDGAGIYTSGNAATGRLIANNIILNGGLGGSIGTPAFRDMGTVVAHGIYLDENCYKVTVTGNTTANCSYSGIYLHNAHDNTIENNLSYNNVNTQIFFAHDGNNAIKGNKMNKNKFIAKSSSANALEFKTSANDISSFGTADNNYYARPLSDNNVFRIKDPSNNYASKDLAWWKTYTGQDANSKKSPISITNSNDLMFEYNSSKTDKVVALGKPMIDIEGTKYQSSITLSPYASTVLIVDPNPSQTTNPVYLSCAIENSTPSVLEMTYNMSLANVIPAVSAFTVKVNSVTRTVNSVAISGTKVLLTLSSPVVYGDVVTIAYTKPSANPLQTSAGGQAASLSTQSVTNRVIPVASITVTGAGGASTIYNSRRITSDECCSITIQCCK